MFANTHVYHLRQQITKKDETAVIHSHFSPDVFECLNFSSYGL